MPWNNNSGGGGWKGGGGARGAQGPQQRGPQPPDLEELLRRSQDRLRSVLPSGGRGNVSSASSSSPRSLVVLWVVQLRLHGAAGRARPGAGLRQAEGRGLDAGPAFPFLAGRDGREGADARAARVHRLRRRPAARAAERNLMLSADQNIVEINFSVLWRVSDPEEVPLQRQTSRRPSCARVAESAMRELVGRSSAEEVRTERRAEVEEGVRALVQSTLDNYDAGITIVGVQLERADPPAEVADAFEEVQRAQQDLDRFQREAEQYANKRLGDARGEAAQITEKAHRLQAAGRRRGGGRVAALPLGARRIRAGGGRDAQAAVPGNDGARARRAPTRSSSKARRRQGVLPYLPLDQLQRNRPAPRRNRAATRRGQAPRRACQPQGGEPMRRSSGLLVGARGAGLPRSIRRSSSSTSASRRWCSASARSRA